MPPALHHAAPARLAALMATALVALLLSLSLSLNAAQAGTKEDIEADLRAGRYTQADQRLQAVRQKHPDNALAAYWHAQVLHKLARDDEARQALRQALQSDPSLRFAAQRKTLDTLAAQLGVPLSGPTESAAASTLPVAQAAVPAERPAPLPAPSAERPIWPWALGLGFVGWLLWRWTRRRAAEATQDFARSTSGPHSYHQPTWQGQPAPTPGGVSGLGAAAIGVGAALATGAVLAAVSQGSHGRDDDSPRHGGGGDGGAAPDFDLGGSGADFDGGGGDFGGDGGGSFD